MTEGITFGSRVRVKESCPWPERRGCVGVVVRHRADHIYPQPSPFESLILIDHDPLSGDRMPVADSADYWGWSCVMDRKDLEVLP